MHLDEARLLADGLVTAMRPYCEAITVAGSIRRERPHVKDVELVVIPLWTEERNTSSLFVDETYQVNQLHQWATQCAGEELGLQWIKPNTTEVIPWTVRPEGQYWRGRLEPEGIKVDIFLGTTQSWGLDLLIRTGNAGFSRQAMIWLRERGLHSREGRLWRDQECLETPTEESVFELMGRPWIPPTARQWDQVPPVAG